MHANHTELLAVLDHPHIPLHTNGSENDIRCQVTKRKVSGGTRSDIGRDCRDAFLGLAKTCASWAWLSGIISAAGSPAQVNQSSRAWQTSSIAADSQRNPRPGFCPCYGVA